MLGSIHATLTSFVFYKEQNMRSYAVVLLLSIHRLIGFRIWSLFCCVVRSVLSSFAIFLMGKGGLVALL